MDYNFEILSLLDNSMEFEKLHSKFNRFNPFKILKVDQFEIRHSNMIAWLLDPTENHHLGSMFVNKLLSKTFVKAENEELIGQYNFIKLHKQSLQDLEVFREVQTENNKRIDILAISESQKVTILIENKYKSSESEGQLQNYIDFVSEKYEGYTIIPIFLSLDGSAPSHTSYLTLDYGDVLNILKAQLEIYSEYTSSTIKDFISYYIDILEGELVRDEEDIELALTVYKNHKSAVDFLCLNGNGKVVGKFVSKELQRAVKKLDDEVKEDLRKIYKKYSETLRFIHKAGNSVMREAFLQFVEQNQIPTGCYNEHIRIPSFIFEEWRQLDEIVGVPKGEWWLRNALITWFERETDGRMKLTIEVGPLEQYENRLKLLCKLEENGVTIKEKAKENGAKFTRIYTIYMDVKDWADQDEILQVMNNIYNNADFNQVVSAIDDTIASFINGEEDDTAEERNQTEENVLSNAFQVFTKQHQLQEGLYKMSSKKPSFIMPEFRLLEEKFGIPKRKWWLNNCAIMWFERLTGNRLKLTLEIGPLESQKRVSLLTTLESKGKKISAAAKKPGTLYSKIYTNTYNISNWSDEDIVIHAMNELFNDTKCQNVIQMLTEIAEEGVHI
ncbi:MULTISPECIES: PD-(D/E)XK nuclease family protein [Bacillus cereus group]|uniref:PDDEXK-like family protein n=1 Tax=Bacillus cereus group TaxID=86661 RepID=UPI001F0F539A|nr:MULTISPECIES: PD-(D/E)XK nuclease family protein [Bacillus cereus group]MCH5438471.1 PD-(D/E)XK nuclease family protein [Bacillus paranthracis]MDA1986262.1 PD-(D/E)XK nuclease family protein [Bacillus cereus group sp. BcHK104]